MFSVANALADSRIPGLQPHVAELQREMVAFLSGTTKGGDSILQGKVSLALH